MKIGFNQNLASNNDFDTNTIPVYVLVHIMSTMDL